MRDYTYTLMSERERKAKLPARPKGVYDNVPSKYGIADELYNRQLSRKGNQNSIFTMYKFR